MSQIRSWWEQRPPGVGAVVLLCIGVVLGIVAVEWMAARHQKTIAVRLANGQVLRMSPEEARTLAVSGGDFSWDFTKVKNPKEPTLPAIPATPKMNR